MFFKKKKPVKPLEFDRENLEPVIRCSICTGEQVAGFRDRHTGRFTEVQLLMSDEDLQQFLITYGLTETPRQIY